MLVEKIKEDRITALKGRNPNHSFLATLYSDIVRVGKDDGNRETTDVEAIRVIKKYLKSNEETLSILDEVSSEHSDNARVKVLAEKVILETYLPKQLTEDQIKDIVGDIINSLTNDPEQVSMKMMGVVMKKLNEDYAGQFDGKMGSTVVKDMLNG